jgi:hypothetical protein
MKQIPLTRGKIAFVDDADFEWLNQWKWYASKDRKGKFYARRKVHVMGKKITVQMHREILDPGPGVMTDHRDGSGLNNQRHNLRTCNHQQNNMNRNTTRGASRYKGVYWHKYKPFLNKTQIILRFFCEAQ